MRSFCSDNIKNKPYLKYKTIERFMIYVYKAVEKKMRYGMWCGCSLMCRK